MLTHAQIWTAIDRLAHASGFSTSGLAKRAGLDPTSFNRSKRFSPDGKERWPSTESIAKILAATGADLSDLTRLVEDEPEVSSPSSLSIAGSLPQRIPFLRLATANRKNVFDDHGYPAGDGWKEMTFPDFRSMDHSLIYALEISGDAMEPLYREGDIVIAAPKAPVRRKDRVVVKTRKGALMIKEFIRRTSVKMDFSAINPSQANFSLPLQEIAWVARIVWVSQ